MEAQQPKLQVEVSHTLAQEQLNGIYDSVYSTTKQAIEDARRDAGIDSDIIYTKTCLLYTSDAADE